MNNVEIPVPVFEAILVVLFVFLLVVCFRGFYVYYKTHQRKHQKHNKCSRCKVVTPKEKLQKYAGAVLCPKCLPKRTEGNSFRFGGKV